VGNPTLVSVRSLTRRYGGRAGIEAVGFDVPEGSLFGFLGPNGSGKTTTIRVLMGLLRPDAGAASIFGRDCWRDSSRIKADVGYLPGDLRLYPWMTGEEGLRLFGRVRGRDIRAVGRELADLLGLDLMVRVRRMSRGMRQKLGLVLAMAHRPRLLVLDEPTSALDPLVQEDVRRYLLSQAHSGQTIFFSSHSLAEVERVCDRVAILREGRLVEHETLEALRARSRRVVEILWKDLAPIPAEPPVFLRLLERPQRRWVCELGGAVSDLLRWSAGQPIEDLLVGPPDLESLFRGYYRRQESGR